MAAEVSRQIKSESSDPSLITRDFLGGCLGIESKELVDLDLHVPHGWEKRLDLKSGKVYIQRSTPASSSSDQIIHSPNPISPKHHDLNPIAIQKSSSNLNPSLILLQETSLDLKLVSNSSLPSTYTSVCTLDKVKSALDRAERESTSSSSSSRKRNWVVPPSVVSPSKSSSSISNSSSPSIKGVEDDVDQNNSNGLLVATACPGCLLYVLISRSDPKCPKCSSVVQMPVANNKKPKIDLNISM